MKKFIIIFFLLSSSFIFGQQIFDRLKIKDLEMTSETASRALYLDASKKIKSSASVSDTELNYLDGVTSALQTQLGNKQAVVSGVDDTEIGYLNGVTSAIQTQIGTKLNSTGSEIVAVYFTTAGQSISNNTVTIVNFGSSVVDTQSRVTTGASWKFTAATGGYYIVSALVQLAASTGWDLGENIYLSIFKNGAELCRKNFEYISGDGSGSNIEPPTMEVTCIASLSATDYVDARIFHVNDASVSLNTGSVRNQIYISILR